MSQRTRLTLLYLLVAGHALLFFLLLFADVLVIPTWLMIAGRLHPAVVHLPLALFLFLLVMYYLRSKWPANEALEHVIAVLTMLVSVSSLTAALFGLFLSRQGTYGADDLNWHKYSGTIFSVLCLVLCVLENTVLLQKVLLRVTIGALSVLVFAAGHSGSVLTHGKNYLWEPLLGKEEDKPSSLFASAVEPLLKAKCQSCHNESKAKGGLVMTDPTRFMAGGEEGVVIVPGNPTASRLIKYLHLPMSDDHHMPPEGKPQLTQAEINLLTTWVKAGADFTSPMEKYADTDSVKILATAFSASAAKKQDKYTFEAASADVITKLNTPFCTVVPVSAGSPALRADFYVRERFDLAALKALTAIQTQLTELNVAFMPIGDEGIEVIAGFSNLEVLNLNFSNAKVDALKKLESLKKLKSLSLGGTSADEPVLRHLLSKAAPERLYVWQTALSGDGLKGLRNDFPNVELIEGPPVDTGLMRLGVPAIMPEAVQSATATWSLKHSMPGAELRYTLDGTTPDSVTGLIYKEPFVLQKSTRVKAIAWKPGWKGSVVVDKILFVSGVRPTAVELKTMPDPAYPGEGGPSLIDGRKGFIDVFKEPSWMAWRNRDMEVEFRFDGKTRVSEVVVSFAYATGSHIFPPESIEVWGTLNGKMSRLAAMTPAQPTSDQPYRIDMLTLKVAPGNYSSIKIKARPVPKLPVWKSKKRDPGWFFTDEVFFY